MAKKKKSGTEPVSLAELAKRAGVTRAAVTTWVKNQEKRGIVLAVPVGRRGKLVDANNPLVRRYVQNTAGTSKRERDAESPENKSGNYLRKLTYQCKKNEIQTELIKKNYIPFNSIRVFLEKFAELETRIFKGFPDRVIEAIEEETKVKLPPDVKAKAKDFLQSAVGSCIKSSFRLIKDFEKKNQPKITERG